MADYVGVRQRCPKTCTRKRCKVHRWEFSVEFPPRGGERRRQVTQGGFESAGAAAEARAAVVEQHRKGTLPQADARRLTVADWLTDWLAGVDDRVRAGDRAPRTATSYRQHVEQYLIPHLGRLRLVDLRADHVEAMFRRVRAVRAEAAAAMPSRGKRQGTRGRARRAPAPLSAATEARIRATLRNACRAAMRKGILHVDPTAAVEQRRGESARTVDPWTWAEFETFTAWLAEQGDDSTAARLVPVVALAARSGLRLGEVCGLRWSDVDLDGGYLTVRQQAQTVDRVVVYRAPKSAQSAGREVPLVPDAVAVLRSHRRRQAAERLAWGEAWEDSGLVFTRPGGAGLVPATLSRAFGGAVRASGVRSCRFHDLRHLAATHMLRNGVPLALVSAVLGHSSTAVTDRHYSHVAARDARAAMLAAFASTGTA